MHLAFVDDAGQGRPSRDGMRPLVATGGVVVGIEMAGWLESELDRLCHETGFPDGERFKWSPDRGDWMRDHLIEEDRTRFFIEVLEIAAQGGVTAMVMISDTDCRPNFRESPSPQFDTTVNFLERVHNHMTDLGSNAVVIADQPGGGTRGNAQFLEDCQRVLTRGTRFVDLGRIPVNIMTTSSYLMRGLQLADLVTSSTVAFIGGEDTHSPPVFEHVRLLLRRDYECIGGRGLKLHPDFRYRNLYHWLLGDTHYVRYQTGSPLPEEQRPYPEGPHVY